MGVKGSTESEYGHYIAHYEELNVFSDPIYGYIAFMKHTTKDEPSEEDLIDSRWIQRMRRIHQLQSAWWVFPSGEHSRFQHAIGVMHLAGQFANHLYGFLEDTCKDTAIELPSRPKFVETARIAGLLHDVGHGPFGHFFDEQYLMPRWGINHEVAGQRIVMTELKPLIEGIRRCPEGILPQGENLAAQDIAYVIKKPDAPDVGAKPEWLRLLRIIFAGVYTADNLDYVCRDAYMTGVSRDAVDISRLLYYTHIHKDDSGKPVVVLHLHGVSALQRFLQTRFFMYDNIYSHRTVRAIEIDMEDVFLQTVEQFLAENPLDNLENYFKLDDWSLISTANELASDPNTEAGKVWQAIIDRRPRWVRAFETRHQLEDIPSFLDIAGREERVEKERKLAERIYGELGSAIAAKLDKNHIRVDIVTLHPRLENPYTDENVVQIYDPATGEITSQYWTRILAGIPRKSFIIRVYILKEDYVDAVAKAAAKVMQQPGRDGIPPTNI